MKFTWWKRREVKRKRKRKRLWEKVRSVEEMEESGKWTVDRASSYITLLRQLTRWSPAGKSGTRRRESSVEASRSFWPLVFGFCPFVPRHGACRGRGGEGSARGGGVWHLESGTRNLERSTGYAGYAGYGVAVGRAQYSVLSAQVLSSFLFCPLCSSSLFFLHTKHNEHIKS